ncbi:MAG: glycosyltransferase family 4 protein [Anaerolineae bacterium]|nr:glycosyltransferase family 4 protein [Anaerolineae bacterium]
MRLLLLSDRIPPENVGGAEAIAWRFALGLHALGHEVHVAAGTPGKPFEEVRDGIPTYHLHSRWPTRLNAYFTLGQPDVTRQLSALYDRIKPDVVGAFNVHGALTWHALTLAHQRGIATSIYFQDAMSVAYGKITHFARPDQCDYPAEAYRLPPLHNLTSQRLRYNPFRTARILDILRRHVDVRVSISQALKTALEANGVPEMQVIYPGLDPADWEVAPEKVEALRDRLNLRGHRVIVLAGRLNPFKGSVQLLRALDRLRHTVPDVRLLILTRSSAEQQGLDRPEFAALRPHIVIGGWMQGEALAAAYQLADVVVTPSTYLDPLVAVNQEAMLCRKPCVTTCFGGPREVVIDGETGFVVNPLDDGALADALARILTAPDLAQRMGEAGYQRVRQHFDSLTQARLMADAYAEAQRHHG